MILANTGQVHPKRRHISSASSALLIGAVLGLIQAFLLIVSAKPLLNYTGIKSVSRRFILTLKVLLFIFARMIFKIFDK